MSMSITLFLRKKKKNNVSMALFVHTQGHIYNLLRQLYECSTHHYRLSEIVPEVIDVCNPFQILVTLVVDISGVHVYGTCPGCRLADSNSIHTVVVYQPDLYRNEN